MCERNESEVEVKLRRTAMYLARSQPRRLMARAWKMRARRLLDEDWADEHVGKSLVKLDGSRRRQGHADGVPRLRSGRADEWISRECLDLPTSCRRTVRTPPRLRKLCQKN